MFGDTPSVYIVYDDVIIVAANDTEHDVALRELLNRAHRFNVRFNNDKPRLKVSIIRYFGNILSVEGLKTDPDEVRATVDMPTPTTIRLRCGLSDSEW